MNHTRWSSFSAAILLSTLSLIPVSQAKGSPVFPASAKEGTPQSSSLLEASLGSQTDPLDSPTQRKAITQDRSPTEGAPLKVGAVQSPSNERLEQNLVARVVSHEYNQRRAATLYVHNIPVLTFLDPQGNPGYRDLGMFSSAPSTGGNTRKTASSSSVVEDESDPTWKASRVASTIYELSRQEAKEEINARWDGKVKGYVITQGQTEIAAVNAYSILPDTTQNLDQDALQVTNRLRRLLTQSSPLRQLTSSRIMAGHGEPVAAGVLKSLQGWASWYGPAFEGRYSANGEVFDSRSMTAAHLTLPFGTQVRVTNLDNGRSVVLRINDRGPYVSGRVLDVSQAAAYALGMIHSGVAPVRVDVLGN